MDEDCPTDVLAVGCGPGAAGKVSPQGAAVAIRLSDEQVRAWVARSCSAQGVPVHVTDVLVLERVRVLLTGTAGPTRQAGSSSSAASRAGSEPPDRPHPVGVERAGAEDTGANDGAVEHGPDDGCLPGQVQLRPLSA